jgi:hypothetical protein
MNEMTHQHVGPRVGDHTLIGCDEHLLIIDPNHDTPTLPSGRECALGDDA